MDYGHPLQIGLALPATPAAVDLARQAEAAGYDLVHLTTGTQDPWTLLTYLAAATDRIGLSVTLSPNDQNPAVLARAAASVDLLSGGRLALALDAADADAVAEALDVLRAMWAAGEPALTYHGEHVRVRGADRGPAPAHTVPLAVSGHRPGDLHAAGQAAETWLAPGRDVLRAGNPAVDQIAVAAGRDPREIRRAVVVDPATLGHLPGTGPWAADQVAEALAPLVLDDGASVLLLRVADPAAADDDVTTGATDTGATDDGAATTTDAAVTDFAEHVAPVLRAQVAAERTRRGTAVDLPRSAWVRARRRPGIDYDAVPAHLRTVEPGDAQYAGVRSGYMRGGSPGLVLHVTSQAEVADALRFARAQDVPLSVRSGGHGISGRSTNDGGIIIDLSPMNRIEVLDPATRRVRVEAGARWGEVAAALQPHGWALSSGDFGGVGVGGLATAGGIGFLGRKHGLTIDHVRAAEVVLADGTHVRASDTEHPDLLWAVRGAGFAMGVVTAFEFEVDEVGDVGFAQLVFDATDTADFLHRWGALVEAAPRDLTSFLIMGAPRGGQVVAQTMTVVDSADPEVVLARLQPFATLGPLLQQQVVITPYAGVVSPPAGAYYSQGEPITRNGLLTHLTPEFATDAARLVRSGQSYFFQIRAMGGAVADVAPDATAFAHRSANFHVSAMGTSRAGLDRVWDPMHHHFHGLYVSFETDPRPERVTDAYPPATLLRLRELKARYDPDNVFRDNLVIAPAAVRRPAPAGPPR